MSAAVVKDFAARAVTTFHRTLFNATRGRVGGKLGGMPVVQLTTIGRKSGQPRTTMLTSPVQDGESLVLVASYGGDDRHPKWFLNLRDNPEVEVTALGKTQAMHARVATPDEKAALWPRVTKAYKGYAGYQTKTDRDIPLVILEPAAH
jgi:deazaflavin-dependent oxidoreductase (nitroreductase family)